VQVRLGYSDRSRAVTERQVHPLGLVAKGSVWYLVADTDAGLRTFRVWRVRAVELSNEAVVRPPGFDLATAWQDVVARMDERRVSTRVSGLADPAIIGWMRGHFGMRLTVGEPGADGRVAVDVGFAAINGAATELAGYGDGLEVLDPPEVRSQLAAIGARLVQRYGSMP